jgi:hypothetical protein
MQSLRYAAPNGNESPFMDHTLAIDGSGRVILVSCSKLFDGLLPVIFLQLRWGKPTGRGEGWRGSH